MADVSGITAVRPGSSATQVRIVQYGATIAAGDALVRSSGKYVLADANASAALAAAEGIALTPGVDNGWGLMAFGGPIILVGATLSVGTRYMLSDTAGKIMPDTDVSSGEWSTLLGTGATTTQLNLLIDASGIQKP
jgi:hypothetical protein